MNKPITREEIAVASAAGEGPKLYAWSRVIELLDYQQSKMEEQKEAAYRSREGWRRCALDAEARVRELEYQIEAAKVEGFKWVDVNQEMPAPDCDTFVIAKFTKKFLSTPGLYNRRPYEIVSARYLGTFTRNYTHWAALPDAPTVADSKRGEE